MSPRICFGSGKMYRCQVRFRNGGRLYVGKRKGAEVGDAEGLCY